MAGNTESYIKKGSNSHSWLKNVFNQSSCLPVALAEARQVQVTCKIYLLLIIIYYYLFKYKAKHNIYA